MAEHFSKRAEELGIAMFRVVIEEPSDLERIDALAVVCRMVTDLHRLRPEFYRQHTTHDCFGRPLEPSRG